MIDQKFEVMSPDEMLSNLLGWMMTAFKRKKPEAIGSHEDLLYYVFASMEAKDWEENYKRSDYLALAISGIPKMDMARVWEKLKDLYQEFEEAERDYTIILAFLDKVNEELSEI